MHPTSATDERTAADAPARVAEAIPCDRCEYNLIGLALDGRCPECGHSIDESIRVGGFWTPARVRALRQACTLLAASCPLWPLGISIPRYSSPTTPARLTLTTLLAAYVVLLIASAYRGLGASSRLEAPRRRLLLVTLGGTVAAVAGAPLLGVARVIDVSTTTMGLFMIAAGIVRLLLYATAWWWIFRGTMGLRPTWSTSRQWLVAALATVLGAWLLLVIAIGVSARITGPFPVLVEDLAALAVAVETIATVVVAVHAIRLSRSLLTAPERIGETNPAAAPLA